MDTSKCSVLPVILWRTIFLQGDFNKGLPQFMKILILKKYHGRAIRLIRGHFVKAQKRQQKEETRRKRHNKPPRPSFVRSESIATKPYEESVPIGHFMRTRSGIRSHSLPIQTLNQDLPTPPELSVCSATSPGTDLSDQSPTSSVSELSTPTQGEFRQDENVTLEIGTVDSDAVIQTGNGPDLVDS